MDNKRIICAVILIIMEQFLMTSCSFGYYEPVINTFSGKIVGKRLFFENIPVYTFLGIPFAKPPIGPYRFKKPVPIEPWYKAFHATHKPPGCIQYSSNPFSWLDDLPGLSEDCLYLNIWNGANSYSSAKKPVLFFIHGGGFRISSSRIDYHDGRVLAALGDVVVVTTNYRLGPMGFLYSGTDDAPGNMGLYDILEALKWVHSNIGFFGGNKENVTLFGQSAGAIAISMFMTSPLFDGLFSRVILDSGAATNLDGENQNQDLKLTEAVARAMGCLDEDSSLEEQSANVIQCLREKDGLILSKKLGQVSDDPQRSLYPRFGDEILPRNAREAWMEGDFANMDMLIGSSLNEGSIMITKAFKDIFGFYGQKYPHLNKTLGEYIMRKNFKKFEDVDAVVKYYFRDVSDDDSYRIWYKVQSASGDFARVCPTVYAAERMAEKGSNVYYYQFTHRSSASSFAPYMGVVHFDEIPFVFGHPLRYPRKYTPHEQQLSRLMIDIWTSFAASGVPSHQPWPAYKKTAHFYHELNTKGSKTKFGPQLKNCNFFRDYFGF